MFKMDRDGNGEEIVLDKLFNSVSCLPSFRNFDIKLFLGEYRMPVYDIQNFSPITCVKKFVKLRFV